MARGSSLRRSSTTEERPLQSRALHAPRSLQVDGIDGGAAGREMSSSQEARSRQSGTTRGRRRSGSCPEGSITRACFSPRLVSRAVERSSPAATTRRSARPPPPGSTARPRPEIRSRGDLPVLRDREPAGGKVLRRVRNSACACLPIVRRARTRRISASAPSAAPRSAMLRPPEASTVPRETPASERRLVVRPLRRPRRLHGRVRAAGRRGDPRAPLAYFELARTLIERYGGEVEKFIGDAVMAVWGTPTATEDDAERAVRSGARSRRRGTRARPRPSGEGRRPDRRGSRDDRRARARAWSPATS